MIFESTKEMLRALGTNLRAQRLAQNLTQMQTAERSGVSLKAVRNLECGNNASTESLLRVCRTLGKTDWLFAIAPPEIDDSMFERRDPTQKRQRASGGRHA